MTEILIVDDEPDIRLLVEAILKDEGYEARSAGTSDEALAAYRARRPALVILDVWLQGSKLDGIGILDVLHREVPRVPVVMISGHGTIETAVAAIQRGAYDFIEKPFNSDRLLLVVKRALEAARLEQENAELRLRVGNDTDLIGESHGITSLLAAVDKVAPTGSRVLISGPPGSGKETVARLIHAKSRRADRPFIVVNCALLAPEKSEAELFGVEAGPETPRRLGALERAHGGTLLLEGVSELPLETQGKIARILQDPNFERVGGTVRVKVDVRVLATTVKDLQAEVADGRFREDLYYRLAVVPLRIPALKERRGDIPALADHFLKHASEVSNLPVRTLASDAVAALQAHDWPGNVRQLRNIMEWLMIMRSADPGEQFHADQLPTELAAHAPSTLSIDPAADVMSMPLREARDIFETQYLQAQLLRFGGNISRTAHFVGMERSALHRKLKQLGIGAAEDKGVASG